MNLIVPGRTGIGVAGGWWWYMEGGADVEAKIMSQWWCSFEVLKYQKKMLSLGGYPFQNKRFETYSCLIKKEVKYPWYGKENTEALGSPKGFTSISKLEELLHKATF
jgi:hypothetical protein